MMYTDAAHATDVSLACLIACTIVGITITSSAYIKFNVVPKFTVRLLCVRGIRATLELCGRSRPVPDQTHSPEQLHHFFLCC